MQSIGLQPDKTLRIEIASTQKESVGQSAWQVAAESVSRNLGIPLQIRADVTSADVGRELKISVTRVVLEMLQEALLDYQ